MPHLVSNLRHAVGDSSSQRAAIILATCWASLAGSDAADGGVLPTSFAAAEVRPLPYLGPTVGGGRVYGAYSATVSGAGTSGIQPFPGYPSGASIAVSGDATSSLIGGALPYWQLSASASVSASYPDGFLPNLAGSYTESNAYYQDVLFLSTTDPTIVGHTIRLNFISSGTAVDPFLSNALARTSQFGATIVTIEEAIGSNGRIGQDFPGGEFLQGIPGTTLAGATFRIGANGPFVTTSGFDSVSADQAGYVGEWHLDIPLTDGGYIDGIPGSVYFQLHTYVTTQLGSIGVYGTTSMAATATDPTRLLSVTLPDVGNVTPESLGATVEFASGAASPDLQSAQSAPEPSTFVMSSTLFLMFGVAALRKRLKATAICQDFGEQRAM